MAYNLCICNKMALLLGMELIKNIFRSIYVAFFVVLILAPALPLSYLYAIHAAAIKMSKTRL